MAGEKQRNPASAAPAGAKPARSSAAPEPNEKNSGLPSRFEEDGVTFWLSARARVPVGGQSPLLVKRRNTRPEYLSSAKSPNSDIAPRARHFAFVPIRELMQSSKSIEKACKPFPLPLFDYGLLRVSMWCKSGSGKRQIA